MPDPTIVAFPQDGRPPPPEHLSLEEAETWKATVGARKAGFFGPEIFPLLEAYCATAMICDRIAAQLRELDEINHEAYESLRPDDAIARGPREGAVPATRGRTDGRMAPIWLTDALAPRTDASGADGTTGSTRWTPSGRRRRVRRAGGHSPTALHLHK